MTDIEITHLTKKERVRGNTERPALFLSVTLPLFTIEKEECMLPNQTIASLAESFTEYLKNDFLENAAVKYGIRHPFEAVIYAKISRMDTVLLSLEMILRAELRHKILFEKHLYLHFAESGTLPVTARDLIGKKLSCLTAKDLTATDPVSGKEYPLKKKYQKGK